jgi:hypothetical protein
MNPIYKDEVHALTSQIGLEAEVMVV